MRLTNEKEPKNCMIMMKKTLLALTMMCMVPTMNMTVWAQQTNNGEQTELTDSTAQDELEAFSDTTAADTSGVISVTPVSAGSNFPFDDDEDVVSVNMNSLFDTIGLGGLAGMGFVLLILFILFVLAPVLILALILYFVYKNRKQRMRLAEMAIKNGQPIPQEFVDTSHPGQDDDLRAKGIRQVALGIGLTFFLGWLVGDIGAGIGILVLCIGLGNLVIARNAKKQREELHPEDFDRTPSDGIN